MYQLPKVWNDVSVSVWPFDRKRIGKDLKDVLLELFAEHFMLLFCLNEFIEFVSKYAPKSHASNLHGLLF